MKFKIANAIMCEFLSGPVNNKHTLVNVIPGELILSEFPANIPAAFYIEIMPQEAVNSNFTLEIYVGNRVVATAVSKIDFEIGKPAIVALPMGLVKIEKPTSIRIIFSDENGRKTCLIKKYIKKGDEPTLTNA